MTKNKNIKNILEKIEKEFGEGSLMNLDSDKNLVVETISSGSLLINEALGVGGYPKGRIIEIYGPESSGKTTLALAAVAEVQKNGGIAAFIDAEHSLDPNFAKRIGVDTKSLIVSQPDSGEQAMEILDHLVNTGEIDLVVVDSVAALVPLVELEGNMTDQTIGAQARLISKSLRKLMGVISKTKTTVIFINQLREKVGVIFGNPEITPGGRALKFYSSMRIDIRQIEKIKLGDQIIGQRSKVKIVKNKLASPYKQTEIEIMYDSGISQHSELLQVAVAKGIIEKNGPWYSYKKEKLGQGKEEAINTINTKNLQTEIIKQIKIQKEA